MKHMKSKRSVCVVPAKPQHPCPPNVGEGGVPHLAQPVLLLWDRGGHSNDWQIPAKTNPGPENRRSCVMAGESAPREAAVRAGESSFQEGGESHLPPPFWSSTFPNFNPLSNVVADHDCLTAPHCAFLKHRTAGDKARTKAGQFSKPDARFGRAALGRRLSPMRGRRQGRLVASLCVNRPPALGGRCSRKDNSPGELSDAAKTSGSHSALRLPTARGRRRGSGPNGPGPRPTLLSPSPPRHATKIFARPPPSTPRCLTLGSAIVPTQRFSNPRGRPGAVNRHSPGRLPTLRPSSSLDATCLPCPSISKKWVPPIRPVPHRQDLEGPRPSKTAWVPPLEPERGRLLPWAGVSR